MTTTGPDWWIRVTELRTPWDSAAAAYAGQRSSCRVSCVQTSLPAARASVTGPHPALRSIVASSARSGWLAAKKAGSPSCHRVALAPEHPGTSLAASRTSWPSVSGADVPPPRGNMLAPQSSWLALRSRSAASRGRSGLGIAPSARVPVNGSAPGTGYSPPLSSHHRPRGHY
ncbi:MAG: hypothetical protein DLM62_05295 [Pseudonocardiales bacterium]|nr:MAG: hypothetical protein DLM62_05295 [Pseudonocardiales bacterium]